KRNTARPVVVLPHPDSPTKPNVSPRLIVKLTSSTALTYALTRESTPLRIGKYFFRFRTSRRGPSGMDTANVMTFTHTLKRDGGRRAFIGAFSATGGKGAAAGQI